MAKGIESAPNIQVGRRVLFVGGPEAGNVRVVPESHGDMMQGDHDWVYRIYPISLPGSKQQAYFAYAADQHPLQMFVDMWRDYSPAAQIRGKMPGVAQTYNTVGSK